MNLQNTRSKQKETDFVLKKELLNFDWISPISILILSLIGIAFIYSAQSTINDADWKKQIIWVFLGVVAYVILSRINYKHILGYAHYIYLLGVLGLLLATPLSPISVEMMGARRWINLGFSTVQPTEAAKIGTLIMVASLLARSNLENVKDLDFTQQVIKKVENPIKESGHIRILYGNIASKGSVAKITGKEGLKFSGPAKVFNSEFDANNGIKN